MPGWLPIGCNYLKYRLNQVSACCNAKEFRVCAPRHPYLSRVLIACGRIATRNIYRSALRLDTIYIVQTCTPSAALCFSLCPHYLQRHSSILKVDRVQLYSVCGASVQANHHKDKSKPVRSCVLYPARLAELATKCLPTSVVSCPHLGIRVDPFLNVWEHALLNRCGPRPLYVDLNRSNVGV